MDLETEIMDELATQPEYVLTTEETDDSFTEQETEYKNGKFAHRITTTCPKRPAIPSILTSAWTKEDHYQPGDIYDAFYVLCKESGYKGTYWEYAKAKEKYSWFKDRIFLSNEQDRIIYRLIKDLPVGKRLKILPRKKRSRETSNIKDPLQFVDNCIASLENICANADISDPTLTNLVKAVEVNIIEKLNLIRDRVENNMYISVAKKVETQAEMITKDQFKLI